MMALGAASTVAAAAQAPDAAAAQASVGGRSPGSTKGQGAECRDWPGPQVSPPDSPKLAGPAPSPVFVAPALASVPAIALAPSHLAPALQGSADSSRLRERTCVLL